MVQSGPVNVDSRSSDHFVTKWKLHKFTACSFNYEECVGYMHDHETYK